MTDKIFPDGLIVKRPDNAPDWLLCKLSFKREAFATFMEQHEKNGWINIECLISKSGNPYSALDTWEPNRQDVHDAGMADAKAAVEPQTADHDKFTDDLIPF